LLHADPHYSQPSIHPASAQIRSGGSACRLQKGTRGQKARAPGEADSFCSSGTNRGRTFSQGHPLKIVLPRRVLFGSFRPLPRSSTSRRTFSG
jgi:hypothetical protein